MRNKKLLSTVVASALAVTTMAMPVMAADQGQVDVDFSTKIPVIRVAVPTNILAAVDPLEMNTSGTQIHSTSFTLENKSEVAVGIDVKSVVTLGTGVTLVDTKEKAKDSTTGSEAWLAVAAETSDGKYIETANKTAGDLTEADKNVTTFKTESAESSASQTFYLNKAASGTTTYKIAAPVASGGKTAAKYEEELNYAQVYELTAETYADEDALLADLQTKDVYEGTADTDGTTLTLIPAGTASYPTFATSNKYFTADTSANKVKAMVDSTKYVYGEGGAGEDTAFRYIGKLGQGKQTWSNTDIDHMKITYSIYGLTDEKFTAANKLDALYLAGPQMTVSASGLITITGLTAEKNYKGLTIKNANGGPYNINDAAVTWDEDNYTSENGGTLTCQMEEEWLSTLRGVTGEAQLTLTDDTVITVAINIPEATD